MSKHQTAIELPDGFSFDWPSYNLILNVSPFPIFSCIELSPIPKEVDENLIWIRVKPGLYGLYEKKALISNTCPLCGRSFNGDTHDS